MKKFPRTVVDGLSLPRMLIGTNWFLGFSHQTPARDNMIRQMTESQIADVLEVFLSHGIDAILGFAAYDNMYNAVLEAQQRTGKKMIIISTPGIDSNDGKKAAGVNAKIFDLEMERGVSLCMPHCSATDEMVDKRTQKIRNIDTVTSLIRERGMIPGLSTHMPETIIYADAADADVQTYISIYNAKGFLMQVEIDWTNSVIRNAKKPVITIKPFASGRLHPFVGLNFSWATLRPQDMVTVGTHSPDEAKEVIEMSCAFFENRKSGIELKPTRSKKSLQSTSKGKS